MKSSFLIIQSRKKGINENIRNIVNDFSFMKIPDYE